LVTYLRSQFSYKTQRLLISVPDQVISAPDEGSSANATPRMRLALIRRLRQNDMNELVALNLSALDSQHEM